MTAEIINRKLKKKIFIEGKIIAKSGLHIGGTNMGLSIGGTDATVVRNPITNEPYIPGSSLKGKMRSLIERVEGKFTSSNRMDAGPYIDNPKDLICQIFGTMPEKMGKDKEPTSRLIVRDGDLAGIIEDDNFTSREKHGVERLFKSKNTDMPYTEVKTEVVIDRITSAATPRSLERVPAGAVFNMSLVLNVFDDDKESDLLNKVFESLKLVQNDYLGGKGTRGSGEIEINILSLVGRERDYYEGQGKEQNIDIAIIPSELKISRDKLKKKNNEII